MAKVALRFESAALQKNLQLYLNVCTFLIKNKVCWCTWSMTLIMWVGNLSTCRDSHAPLKYLRIPYMTTSLDNFFWHQSSSMAQVYGDFFNPLHETVSTKSQTCESGKRLGSKNKLSLPSLSWWFDLKAGQIISQRRLFFNGFLFLPTKVTFLAKLS